MRASDRSAHNLSARASSRVVDRRANWHFELSGTDLRQPKSPEGASATAAMQRAESAQAEHHRGAGLGDGGQRHVIDEDLAVVRRATRERLNGVDDAGGAGA